MACLHESQALAFVAGELDAPGRSAVEDHVDDCAQCRQLLAELVRKNKTTDRVKASDPAMDDTQAAPTDKRPVSGLDATQAATDRDRPISGIENTQAATDKDRPPAPLGVVTTDEWTPGTRVGRYVVLARIGRGGMGTVFRAEDVELGRPVALKRLHADADAESRARLLREARSAAQLQHPNVVSVYEVDEDRGTPFLAMELVDGVTLTAWLREKTRSWREIVNVVAQAGRGLAAAHERGLVHRDFKPDNVLVDRTGRARVADFGLARAGDATPSEPVGVPIPMDARLARMTATGSLAGTPAYMAPELVEGGSPDPRSDQYAFAITLYEALRGQHPFEGTTAARLWVEMAAGRIRSGGRSVPAWLDKHLRRGLEVAPEKRWPDLASFVAAIEKPPRRALWIGGGLGTAALASTVAFVALREPPKSGPTCEDLAAEYKLSYRDDELARAIPDSQQLARAHKALDRFTQDYRKALRDSCRATAAGTQSAAIGDKRTACLELAKRQAWFVTSGITSGVDKRPGLTTLLDELPDVTACSDPEWLERAAPLPVAQADREALYAAESDLLRASKVRDDGNLVQASSLLEGVIATAKRLNDRSLDARANLLSSEIAHDRGDMEQASLDAMEAWSAASMTGDTPLTLRTQLALMLATASRDKRSIEGFSGLGNVPESADGAKLIVSYGDALMASGHFKEGEEQYRRAQAMREKVLPPDHVDLALGLQRIGAALVIQKKAAEALPVLQKAHAVVEKAFPPLRREAIDGVRYLAMAEEELGHLDRALELRREVFDRRAKVHGARHGMTLDARKDLAEVLGELGHDDEAITELEAVVNGFLDLMGERSVNAADARVTLANKLMSNGRFAEADEALAKAVPILTKANGPDSPYTMVGEYALVRSYVERPTPIKLDEATHLLDHMEPTFAKLFGASSYPVAAVVYSRARIAAAKNDLRRADELMANAVAMLGDDKRMDRAEMKLFRATLAFRLGKLADARALAEASAKDYEAAGAGFANRAALARAWATKPSAAVPMPKQATAAPAAAVGECDKAGREWDDTWPEEKENAIGWHKDRDAGERKADIIDRYVADWRAAARSACIEKQGGQTELSARRMMCLDRARATATARIMSVANGTTSAIKDRSSLPDFTSCSNLDRLHKLVMPTSQEQRDAIELALRELEYARIMLDKKYPQQADRHVNGWGEGAIAKANDPEITERAAALRAEIKVQFDELRAAKATP